MKRTMALIFLGGGLGAIMREVCVRTLPSLADGAFPLDIFAANMLACLILGVVDGFWAVKRLSGDSHAFLATGLAGGLSTFSSFILGPFNALEVGASPLTAVAYLFTSLLCGVFLVRLGQGAARLAIQTDSSGR